MKITTKLGFSFAIMSFVAVMMGVLNIVGIIIMSGALDDMYANKAKPLGELTTATEYFQRLRVQANKAIIYAGDAEELAIVEKDINDRFNQFETSMAAYKPSIASEIADALFTNIMDKYNNIFKPGIRGILDGAKTGVNNKELFADMEALNETENVISKDISGIVQTRMDVMGNANDLNKQTGQQLLIWSIFYVVAALVISTIFSLTIPLSISKPVIFIKDILLKIGTKGDLTFTEEEQRTITKYAGYKDETGESISMLLTTAKRLNVVGRELEALAGGDFTAEIDLLSDKDTMGLSLKRMVSELNELLSEINTSSAEVSNGSKQVSDGAQVFAQGSSEQAASVEELTGTMSEMADMINKNSDTANRAAALANNIKQNAEKGNVQMDEMIAAVNDINQAGLSINKVIKVIDDIAFQTNILALNAAVEAARAGQHGKGFAVVAEEVRNLAAKSAEAAKDTGVLITNSINKAELGTHIAGATAASLSEIVEGINESTKLVGEIADSSKVQSASIAQINRSIEQVAQVIQTNSAAAEESAAASEEMSSQANLLESLVAQFKLKK